MRDPLRKNRDFVLLQAGELLSAAGTQSSVIAYLLLVLAVTHSPQDAGIVSFARTVPYVVFGLFAGVAADRWNRKRMMLASDTVRALALASLVITIAFGGLTFAQIAIVSFVEGTCFVFFNVAAAGALRSVVPASQLADAAGAEQARLAIVRLTGPPVGGALFGLGRALPFLADAVSYVFSIASLLAIRKPFQEERETDTSRLRSQIAEGFRFLWQQPFLRTTALIFAIANFAFSGLMLAVIVIGKRQGLPSGQIGLLVAALGASTLLGAFVSGVLRRRFSMRTILVVELWAAVGSAAFIARPNVYVLVAGLLPQSFVIPVTDSLLNAYRYAVAPDRLVGRLVSITRNIGLIMTPLGPLAAGFLLGSVSARTTVAVFAACVLAIAIWGTLSPSIRTVPTIPDTGATPHAPERDTVSL
ncbi:MAG TPA: MFS transporter [Gaiellaceae bacterium]|nr:MFS transporter [Gaiellaceae bacterium]